MLGQEHLFVDLNRWGGNAILLEIYQLLEPSDEWHPQPTEESYIYVCLGFVYNTLGQKQEALRYFKEALDIRREVGDRSGEGTTLLNIGAFYFEKANYPVALAYFLIARHIFEEVQSPNRDLVQSRIDGLREEVGEQAVCHIVGSG